MVSLVWSSPCLTLHFGINTLYSHGMVQPMRWGRSGSTSYCWSMGEWSWGLFTLHLGTRSPVHVEIVMESLKPSETRGEMVVRNSTWSNVALTFDHEHQFNMHDIIFPNMNLFFETNHESNHKPSWKPNAGLAHPAIPWGMPRYCKVNREASHAHCGSALACELDAFSAGPHHHHQIISHQV